MNILRDGVSSTWNGGGKKKLHSAASLTSSVGVGGWGWRGCSNTGEVMEGALSSKLHQAGDHLVYQELVQSMYYNCAK